MMTGPGWAAHRDLMSRARSAPPTPALSAPSPHRVAGDLTTSVRTADMTAVDRHRSGKEARKDAPLSSHAELWPSADRDAVSVLTGEDATRVPELVPIRYGRMLVSPFTFYRGAAALMAGDLSGTPVSGLRTQTCGDAHLSNFGL